MLIQQQWKMDDQDPFREHDLGQTFQMDPPIDQERLAYLRELMEGVFVEMIDLFLKNIPNQIRALKMASEKGDARALFRLAHSIQSSAAHLGARKLSELSQKLETENQTGKHNGNIALIDRIENEFQRVRIVLEVKRRGD